MHLKDVCTLTNTHLHTRNWTRWKQKKITKLLALQASCCWSLWDESCNAGPSTPFSLNLPHVYATQSYNMQRPEGLHKCINKLVPDYLADMFKSRSQVHNRQTRSSLKWLPIREKLILNDATMMHKCINKLVPDYLADMFKSRSQVAWNSSDCFESFSPLNNVWIDRPLMPSSDVTHYPKTG